MSKYLKSAEQSLGYIKNNPKILVPDIILFFLPFIAGFIFLIINKLMIYSNLTVANLSDHITSTITTLMASTPGKLQLFFSALIIVISSIAVGLGFVTIRFVMIREAVKGKKIGLYRASRIAAKLAFFFFWLKLIIALIYLITLGILALLVLSGNIFLIILAILIFIVALVSYAIMFIFTVPEFFYSKSKNPFRAIKKSIIFARKNLKFTLSSILVIIIISIMISMVNQALTQVISAPLYFVSVWLAGILTGLFLLITSVISNVWTNSFLFNIYKKEL